MKMKLTRTLILTVVAMIGAAAAHGQPRMASADVAFGFRAAGVNFAPGVYNITENRQQGTLIFQNERSGSAKFVTTTAPASASSDRHARLVFVCGEERGCALSTIVVGDGRKMNFSIPRPKRSEMSRTAVVNLQYKQAD